jgi:hypothetical protein
VSGVLTHINVVLQELLKVLDVQIYSRVFLERFDFIASVFVILNEN